MNEKIDEDKDGGSEEGGWVKGGSCYGMGKRIGAKGFYWIGGQGRSGKVTHPPSLFYLTICLRMCSNSKHNLSFFPS